MGTNEEVLEQKRGYSENSKKLNKNDDAAMAISALAPKSRH
jgi:hypothetical protein